MIDFELISKLNKEIEALIKERPELRELQDEINEVMNKVGSTHNRNAAINALMMEKFHELNKVLQSFSDKFKDIE